MEFVSTQKRPDTTSIEALVARFKAGEVKDGDAVRLKGTLHRIKEMSGFAFVNVRSSRLVFQCIWEEGTSTPDIKEFSVEECVIIDGTVVFEERSRLGFDIRINTMERISGKAAIPPVEISNDRKMEKLNLNTLLDHRVITLRNPKKRAIL